MPPTEDALKWWNSFKAQAFEMGYDFNNPADRALLRFYTTNHVVRGGRDIGDMPVSVGAFISTPDEPLREFDYHDFEWYLNNQAEISDDLITLLYNKAQSHDLVLEGHESNADYAELSHLVNVDRDGNAHISRSLRELGINDDDAEERNRILNDEFQPVAGNPEEIYSKLTDQRMLFINAEESEPESFITIDEYREITGEPDAPEIQFVTFHDLRHQNIIDHHEPFISPAKLPGVPDNQQLQALTDNTHGVTELEKLVAARQGVDVNTFAGPRHDYNFQLYDRNMRPFDAKADPAATRKALTGDGLYFFKQGEAAPHRISFNKEHNRLAVTANPLAAPMPVKKPGFFRRIGHSIATALGFKGFSDCTRYNEYSKRKSIYDKSVTYNDNRTAFYRAAEERRDERAKEIAEAAQENAPEVQNAIEISSVDKLYNKARLLQQNLLQQKNSLSQGEDAKDARSEYRSLLKATASGVNHIAESIRANGASSLREDGNTYIARIVSLSLIQQERAASGNPDKPGPRETILNKIGAEHFVKLVNNSKTMTEFKKNFTDDSLLSVINDRGFDLAKTAVKESELTAAMKSHPARNIVNEVSASKGLGAK